MAKIVLIAGATGNLGKKVIEQLQQEDVILRAIIRKETSPENINFLKTNNVEAIIGDFNSSQQLITALNGVDCVLSTLSGLHNVVVEIQKKLIDAATEAKVPRFISSDFSIDHRNLALGNNRNLDFRKEFYTYANTKTIQVTSIFTGAFMDLLKTDMPLILKKQKWILCWGNKFQKMEFTHTNDVAAFTAKACLDQYTPRNLFIAGSVMNCQNFAALMTKIQHQPYKILRPGGIRLLNFMIKLTRFFSPSKNELYPAWQGMQYMRDMMEGRVQLQTKYDNLRYGNLNFLDVETFLKQ